MIIKIALSALSLTAAMWVVGEINSCDAKYSYNVAIGCNAGASITLGSRNLLIGENADVPDPSTNDFVNLWNVVKIQGRAFSDIGRGAVLTYLSIFGPPIISCGNRSRHMPLQRI